VWVATVFCGLPVFIHAIEPDGAGSDGAFDGCRSAATSGTREASGSGAAAATTGDQPPCCTAQLRRPMRNACSARRRMREGKSRARATPTTSKQFAFFSSHEVRSHAHECLRHQIACTRILLASHYLPEPPIASHPFSFVRASDRYER
jgi:hypothetical protein